MKCSCESFCESRSSIFIIVSTVIPSCIKIMRSFKDEYSLVNTYSFRFPQYLLCFIPFHKFIRVCTIKKIQYISFNIVFSIKKETSSSKMAPSELTSLRWFFSSNAQLIKFCVNVYASNNICIHMMWGGTILCRV